ncbi:MAG: hypothetical protein P8103_13320 [Candidatus Thiodiazotropha sp.]
MRRLLWLLWLPGLALAEPQTAPPGPGEPSHCPDCHRQETESFKRSRMAVAARTPDFLREWKSKGRVERCLACHAPSGGKGVECGDCHGDTGHPYPRLETPAVCARCHDAPGEVTVRSYRRSPAARQGEGCLDCHLDTTPGSHDFAGPMRAGFLEGIARLRLSLRRDEGGDTLTLLIGIRHRAGHALPGGTTGRSVWLVVESFAPDGRILERSTVRFGWFHDSRMEWRDRTLPPGPGKVIEIPLQGAAEATSVEARLLYRFRPGPLETPDPREVELDRARFALSHKMRESR